MNMDMKEIIKNATTDSLKNQAVKRSDIEVFRKFMDKAIEQNAVQAALGFKLVDQILPAASTIDTLSDAQADSLKTYLTKHGDLDINEVFIQPCPRQQRYPRVISYRVLNQMTEEIVGSDLTSLSNTVNA